MELEKDSLTDWIQLIFSLIGGLYALYLFQRSIRDKRNQYVQEVLNGIYNDLEVRKVLYSVDTGTETDEIRFGGQLEKEADKTIRYFDYVGYLIKQGNIRRTDIEPFEYEINRILHNPIVLEYISWLRGIGVRLDYLQFLTRG